MTAQRSSQSTVGGDSWAWNGRQDPEEKTLRHSLAFLIVSAMMLCLIIPRKTRASQEMRTETFGYKRTYQRPETRAHEEDEFR